MAEGCWHSYKTATVVMGRARRRRFFSPSTRVDVKVGDVMSVVGVTDNVRVTAVAGVEPLSSAACE